MTSNLGAEHLAAASAESSEESREAVMNAVRAHFRPEFLNRVDEIILFHRLKAEHMASIVDIQMKRLLALLSDRHIDLELDDAARTWIGNQGYDPVYGARPLKRVIQKQLQDPLAKLILEGVVRDGDTIKISVADGALTFNGKTLEALDS